ncbi:MAG: M48 family metallopeptidase [Myxococcales bacterium]|nr:M48 family metallopeptidase [Myxococcales bacterium]
MPTQTIGQTRIDYTVQPSPRARRQRIEVTPDGVVVVAPAGTPDAAIQAFVHAKRGWLLNAVAELAQAQAAVSPQGYAGGAKLQYRGRWLSIEIKAGPVDAAQVVCRSRFHVTVPGGTPWARWPTLAQPALQAWLRARAERDAPRLVRRHAAALGVTPKAVRLSDAKDTWGHCDADGTVRVHWRLVQAPLAALTYVAAHEATHLVHRHHGPAFWTTLARTLPDWAAGKAALEKWEREPRAV